MSSSRTNVGKSNETLQKLPANSEQTGSVQICHVSIPPSKKTGCAYSPSIPITDVYKWCFISWIHT